MRKFGEGCVRKRKRKRVWGGRRKRKFREGSEREEGKKEKV